MKLYSFKDDVVCDPFLGSGTSAVVALELGRTFHGFDRQVRFINEALDRIQRKMGVAA